MRRVLNVPWQITAFLLLEVTLCSWQEVKIKWLIITLSPVSVPQRVEGTWACWPHWSPAPSPPCHCWGTNLPLTHISTGHLHGNAWHTLQQVISMAMPGTRYNRSSPWQCLTCYNRSSPWQCLAHITTGHLHGNAWHVTTGHLQSNAWQTLQQVISMAMPDMLQQVISTAMPDKCYKSSPWQCLTHVTTGHLHGNAWHTLHQVISMVIPDTCYNRSSSWQHPFL